MDRYPAMDRPDLVPDRDALTCRWAGYGLRVGPKHLYEMLFQVALGRRPAPAELEEIWSKVLGYHHVPYDQTWEAAVERIKAYPHLSDFWRSQV